MTGDEISNDIKSRSEWTMAKEIIGTFIGIAPFVIALVMWGSSINERIRVIEVKTDHLDAADHRNAELLRDQRTEIIARMDRIGQQIEALQQTVARINVNAGK